MATSIKWPPSVVGGRIEMVSGPEVSTQMVMMTLSDLSQNPFNPDDASMGDVTFRSKNYAQARINLALRRLKRLVAVNRVEESSDDNGKVQYIVNFTDRESRSKQSVTIDG
jgi:hypothetical protein